jgi:hypothetical protein
MVVKQEPKTSNFEWSTKAEQAEKEGKWYRAAEYWYRAAEATEGNPDNIRTYYAEREDQAKLKSNAIESSIINAASFLKEKPQDPNYKPDQFTYRTEPMTEEELLANALCRATWSPPGSPSGRLLPTAFEGDPAFYAEWMRCATFVKTNFTRHTDLRDPPPAKA